jgi:hypothetical protein
VLLVFFVVKRKNLEPRNHTNDTKCRCCGYVPPVRAGGSAFVLLMTDNDLSKNPVATAPGSDQLSARRQLFDDIMNENCGVTGIFPILRGFLGSTRFSRNCAVFSI